MRNCDDAEDRATAGHDGGPHEVTIVETHTPDAPFIFESLKNFFQKEGLRVFSAVHPMFTVTRQWERIDRIGPRLTVTWVSVSSAVVGCAMISAMFISQIRLAKCSAQNFSGRPVAAAKSLGSSVDELVASKVCSRSKGAIFL